MVSAGFIIIMNVWLAANFGLFIGSYEQIQLNIQRPQTIGSPDAASRSEADRCDDVA